MCSCFVWQPTFDIQMAQRWSGTCIHNELMLTSVVPKCPSKSGILLQIQELEWRQLHMFRLELFRFWLVHRQTWSRRYGISTQWIDYWSELNSSSSSIMAWRTKRCQSERRNEPSHPLLSERITEAQNYLAQNFQWWELHLSISCPNSHFLVLDQSRTIVSTTAELKIRSNQKKWCIRIRMHRRERNRIKSDEKNFCF